MKKVPVGFFPIIFLCLSIVLITGQCTKKSDINSDTKVLIEETHINSDLESSIKEAHMNDGFEVLTEEQAYIKFVKEGAQVLGEAISVLSDNWYLVIKERDQPRKKELKIQKKEIPVLERLIDEWIEVVKSFLENGSLPLSKHEDCKQELRKITKKYEKELPWLKSVKI
jgi:hypothetical protein